MQTICWEVEENISFPARFKVLSWIFFPPDFFQSLKQHSAFSHLFPQFDHIITLTAVFILHISQQLPRDKWCICVVRTGQKHHIFEEPFKTESYQKTIMGEWWIPMAGYDPKWSFHSSNMCLAIFFSDCTPRSSELTCKKGLDLIFIFKCFIIIEWSAYSD